MMKNLCLVLFTAAIGCGGEKDEENTDDTTSVTTETQEDFAPTEGSWSFDDSEYTNDDCTFSSNPAYTVDVLDALVYTLTNTSDTVVTMTNDVGTLDCTRDGMELSCETQVQENELTTYNDADGNEVVDADGNPVDPDATVTIDAVFNGTFVDADNATYTATLTGACTGADCDAVAEGLGIDNPCTSTLEGKLKLEE